MVARGVRPVTVRHMERHPRTAAEREVADRARQWAALLAEDVAQSPGTGPIVLTAAERGAWREATGTAEQLLRLGGPTRTAERQRWRGWMLTARPHLRLVGMLTGEELEPTILALHRAGANSTADAAVAA